MDPQLGLDYADQLAAAKAAEAAGFDAFFRSDHYGTTLGSTAPTATDAWAVLAGLARETDRIMLGTLVSPVTFRGPGNLAVLASTVQQLSGGRLVLGLGAGWDAAEHARFGFEFPSLRTRLSMLEEQLQVVRGIWSRPDWRFKGNHYLISGPGPVLAGVRPPLIVGGIGGRRSLSIAARWADGYSLLRADPAQAKSTFAALDQACAAEGRPPGAVAKTVVIGVVVGDKRSFRDRSRRLQELLGGGSAADAWIAERRAFWVHGSIADLIERIVEYQTAGCDAVVLDNFVARDLEMIADLGDVVRSVPGAKKRTVSPAPEPS